MDSLQKQVSTLDTKVDALHKIVEQLSSSISENLSEMKSASAKAANRSQIELGSGRQQYRGHRSPDTSMEHKDVLVDTNFFDSDSQSGERELAPEIQIQRLTAQLTAAYNRIAALEEQLLAQRIH